MKIDEDSQIVTEYDKRIVDKPYCGSYSANY